MENITAAETAAEYLCEDCGSEILLHCDDCGVYFCENCEYGN